MTEQAAPGAEEMDIHRQPSQRTQRESKKCSEVYFCIGMNAETETLRALSIGKLILCKLCVSSHLTRKESVTKFLEYSIAFSHRSVFVDILFKDIQ